MKKVLIATIAGILLQLSYSEAQIPPGRELPASKENVQPPPPPPPPPVPPIPAKAEIPPVPPQTPEPPMPPLDGTESNVVRSFVPPPVIQDELNRADVNEKGYVIIVRKGQNRKPEIHVFSDGAIIKKVKMDDWMNNRKLYEDKYGELPPPPPPPAPSTPLNGRY